ncbi:MAG: RNA polymerase sigma-70 factor [Phocaeicola sp.]|uniref:RNA polymerase sigma-70 factor n=1 Tax=Phocaeicola sp. TaxID=2773926 RepID=UPI003F9F44DA
MNKTIDLSKHIEKEKHFTFNVIYNTYYRRSFLFVKSYVRDDFVAEDIVSDSMIALWQNIDYSKSDSIPSFLLTILKNRALDYLKHKKMEQKVMTTRSNWEKQELNIQIEALEACDPSDIFSEEIKNIVEKTLDSLPDKTKQIFQMSRMEEKTNKQIASELDLSEKAVEYHISRALRALYVALKDYLPLFYFFFYFI